MSPQAVRKLTQIFKATEIRHNYDWYLLAVERGNWRQVGGPFGTREEARAAKRKALQEWSALPEDVIWSYINLNEVGV